MLDPSNTNTVTAMSFKDQVVLVTGSSSGIGRAIAIHFAKENAKIILVGRSKPALDEVKAICSKNSGHEALAIQADVSNDGQVEDIVEKVTSAYGALHVLVNNAGVFISDDIFSATTASFDAHINVNLRSVFNLTRLFVPLLVKSKGKNMTYINYIGPSFIVISGEKKMVLSINR